MSPRLAICDLALNGLGKPSVTGTDRLDGINQQFEAKILHDVAERSGLEHAKHFLLDLIAGDDQDAGIGKFSANRPHNLDAPFLRHAQVQEEHVGFQLSVKVDGHRSIGCFSDNFKTWLGSYETTDANAIHKVIVCHKNADM